MRPSLWLPVGLCIASLLGARAGTPPPAISVRPGDGGALVYAADEAGNRIIDFSHAGYGGGGVALPQVPARISVEPAARSGGDGSDRARIQAAIDRVAAMPVAADGFRGLSREASGTSFGVAWLDAAGGALRGAPEPVVAGGIVTLTPPVAEDAKQPRVAWLTRR